MNDKIMGRIVTGIIIIVSLWWTWMILDTAYDMRELHLRTIIAQIEAEQAKQKTYEMYQQALGW